MLQNQVYFMSTIKMTNHGGSRKSPLFINHADKNVIPVQPVF